MAPETASTGGAGDLPAAFRRALEAEAARLGRFGVHVRYLETVASTNDELAREALAGAPEGAVVVAGAQTAGRGRSGRSWFSPAGAGLYVSVLLRPRAADDGAAPEWTRLITLAAGLAVVDGLRAATSVPLEIKWPNDIVAREPVGAEAAADERGGGPARWRKVAGILAEGRTEAGRLQHVVLGYGVNIGDAAYPAWIADRAASLEGLSRRPVSAADVLVETLAAVRREYDALPGGPHAALLQRWSERSPLSSGAPVAWEEHGARQEGMSAGITAEGALLVHGPRGLRALAAGEVTWL